MMAEEKVESKKLEEFKKTPENKAVVAEAEGKGEILATDSTDLKKIEEVEKEKSKPAVAKVKTEKKDKETRVELEREYIVPLRRGFMNVPHYRRAKKAVKVLKEFMVRHMNVRDGDTRKIKVDIALNNEIWFRGIRKPLNKIKVKAKKVGDIVTVTLANPADYVKFKMAREEKVRAKAMASQEKPKKVIKKKEDSDKDKDGVEDKKEEAEDKKAGAEKAAKVAKVETKVEKHTVSGKHAQKVAPVRKVLK